MRNDAVDGGGGGIAAFVGGDDGESIGFARRRVRNGNVGGAVGDREGAGGAVGRRIGHGIFEGGGIGIPRYGDRRIGGVVVRDEVFRGVRGFRDDGNGRF